MLPMPAGERDDDQSADSPAQAGMLQSPREIMLGRVMLVRADLTRRGMDVTEAEVFHSGHGPYGRMTVLLPAATDATLAELLDRHGLSPRFTWIEGGAEPVLHMELTLGAMSEAARRRMADAGDECVDRGVGVIEARMRFGLTGSQATGVLRLRLSASAGLGLASLAVLATTAHRHGLRLPGISERGSGRAGRSLALQLKCQDDVYWPGHLHLTQAFFVQRLAAVAAEFPVGDAGVFRFLDREIGFPGREIGGPAAEYGLLARLPGHLGRPGEPAALVLTAGPRGWHVRFPVYPPGGEAWLMHPAGRGLRYVDRGTGDALLLDVGLGAAAADIAAAAADAVPPPSDERPIAPAFGPPAPAEWITIVGTAAVTSVVLPFVQALVGKAAEDAYAAVRRLLHRGLGNPVTADQREISPAADPAREPLDLVAIRDPETNTELVMPTALPDDAIRQLLRLGPGQIAGLVLTWDEHTQTWRQARRRPQEREPE